MIKIRDFSNELLGVHVLEDEPVIYVFSDVLTEMRLGMFLHSWGDSYLTCDECGWWIDKRTKAYKRFRSGLELAFMNKKLWSDL